MKYIVSAVFSLIALSLYSQDILTVEQAVQTALENNYAIKIANKDVELAENNTSKEALGYNPTVNAQAGLTSELGSSTQNFSSGESASTAYAFSYGANASVGAQYNIIDPSRDITYEQLTEVLNLTDLQKKFTIEQSVFDIMSSYYNIARQAKNIELQNETIGLTQQRLDRALINQEYGQGSRVDVLNAQVDIDRDSIALINLIQLMENEKRNLNNLMGINIDMQYDIDEDITFDNTLSLEGLIAAAEANNTQLLMMDKNMDITEMDYRLIDATRRPSLAGSASYSFTYSKSAPGAFFSSSTRNGLGLGLTLSYNLYDGGLRKVQEQTTKLTIENQELQKENIWLALQRDITNAWYNYQNALYIIEREKSNVQTTQTNYERSEELFKIGNITSIELRQAQLNLLNAGNSLINAEYDAKLIEIQLRFLTGQIINQ